MLLVQLAFAVHALRRGYPVYWVFLIVFVPVIGCLLYVIMVLLPEMTQSRAATDGARVLRKALNPGKVLRDCEAALELSDTVSNRVALAEAYREHGKLDEAMALYERSLTGIYRDDPALLARWADAQVQAGRLTQAKTTLETLAQAHPDEYKPPLRLLMARVLEGLGQREAALAAYARLLDTAAGMEVQCRYALLLQTVGREAQARALFQEILRGAKAGSRHSQQLNRVWIETARKALG